MVHSCLQLRLIRHEWGASFFNMGASLKNYSCRLQRIKPCGSFDPKADKLLVSLDSFLPHKKMPLEGSAHPRVLFALGLKNPHSFVTRGKGTPPHVQTTCTVVFETCSTRVVVVHSYLQLRLIRHEWGAFFFNVGASLKNYSRRLQRTKLCGSFDPKADKLLAGLDSFLPHVL